MKFDNVMIQKCSKTKARRRQKAARALVHAHLLQTFFPYYFTYNFNIIRIIIRINIRIILTLYLKTSTKHQALPSSDKQQRKGTKGKKRHKPDESDSDSDVVPVKCFTAGDPVAFTDASGKVVAYGIVVDGEPPVDVWWGEEWCEVPAPWQRDELWIEVNVTELVRGTKTKRLSVPKGWIYQSNGEEVHRSGRSVSLSPFFSFFFPYIFSDDHRNTKNLLGAGNRYTKNM